METKKQYLASDELTSNLKVHFNFTPKSLDTYNETELLEAVRQQDIQKCFMIGVSFALTGAVRGSYGTIQTEDDEVQVSDLMSDVGCLHPDNKDKLSSAQITPKRMARLFRYHISEYIKSTGKVSFLVKKYNIDAVHPELCFPGAEYMVSPDESKDLIKAYHTLDAILNTNFCKRVALIIYQRAGQADKVMQFRQALKSTITLV